MARVVVAVTSGLALIGTGVVQAATPSSLKERLCRSNEVAGFEVAGGPFVTRDPGVMGVGRRAGIVKQVRRNGFVAEASELIEMKNPLLAHGDCEVVQFRTASGAQADLIRQVKERRRDVIGTFSSFVVPAVPGSAGTAMSNGDDWVYAVDFRDGSFTYEILGGTKSSAINASLNAEVVAAAVHLYRRVHSHAS